MVGEGELMNNKTLKNMNKNARRENVGEERAAGGPANEKNTAFKKTKIKLKKRNKKI
jgi:hypothetical protein